MLQNWIEGTDVREDIMHIKRLSQKAFDIILDHANPVLFNNKEVRAFYSPIL